MSGISPALVSAFLGTDPTVVITAITVIAGSFFVAFMVYLAFGLETPTANSADSAGSPGTEIHPQDDD